MSACGGHITTNKAVLDISTKRAQLAGTSESRIQLTVKANPSNAGTVFLVPDTATPASEGWPLAPGEGYTFGGGATPRGARAALYAFATVAGDSIYVMTEGE